VHPLVFIMRGNVGISPGKSRGYDDPRSTIAAPPNPMMRRLLDCDEPSLRYKTRVGVLGENSASKAMWALR
jgi:hypothetical protein